MFILFSGVFIDKLKPKSIELHFESMWDGYERYQKRDYFKYSNTAFLKILRELLEDKYSIRVRQVLDTIVVTITTDLKR